MHDYRQLPPEIWLEIFEWATCHPRFLSDHHTPFRDVPHYGKDPNLQVRANLSCVCRTWQMWAAQLLYRDIQIRHGAHALKHALEDHQSSGRSYGELVR